MTEEKYTLFEVSGNLLVQLQGQVDTKDGHLESCSFPIEIEEELQGRDHVDPNTLTTLVMEAISDNDNGGKADNSSSPLLVARQKEIAHKNSCNVRGRSYAEQIFIAIHTHIFNFIFECFYLFYLFILLIPLI